MEIIKEILKRLKRPGVLVGVFGLFIAISGINPENMTSWSLLWDNIKEVAANPFMTISIVCSVFSYLNDPTSKDSF